MDKENAIEVLNTLITINNDRIEGYETATKKTEEHDLKIMFAQFILTSQKCKQELVLEVNKLGGEAAEGTLTAGKIFRVWMDVKATITGKDRKAILNSCKFGEDVAEDTYENALENDFDQLSADQQLMIYNQKNFLKSNQNYIKALCIALAEA